jgi:hypothetical protein
MLASTVALSALLAGAAGTAAPRPDDCRVEVVRPDVATARAEFLAWLRANWKQAGWTEGAVVLGDDPAGSLDAYSLFVVDVDNDGALEHVLTATQGSGAYLALWVFRPAPGGWRLDAENALDDPLSMAHEYGDPLGDGSRLFLRVCGRTFIQLAEGIYPGSFPAPLVWERGKVGPACAAAWVKEQRRVFRALFDRKRYDVAYGLLGGVAGCAETTDPQTWLWIQSDLAAAAHRIGTYDDCLRHVSAARASPRFSSATPALRTALDTNARLCERARSSESASGYDFSWLREWASDPARQIAVDPRFAPLLRAVVPDAPNAKELREDLKLAVYLPEPTQVRDGRYVVVSGCQPHNCENKGLIWVDTTARKAIFAMAGILGSRQIPSGAIPPQFWDALRDLGPGLWPYDGTDVIYIEPDGKESKVAARER